MTQTNDEMLATKAREVQVLTAEINEVMAAGSAGAVVTLAAKIEDAARKLGWRALEIRG